jgi:hypothetical protein
MAEGRASELPIVVELAPPLDLLREESVSSWLVQRTRTAVGGLLSALRIDARPAVTVRPGASMRVLRVFVHGRARPFPPQVLRESWLSVAPAVSRAMPDQTRSDANRYPDGWVGVEAAASVGDEQRLKQLVDLVAEATRSAIALRPSCLLSGSRSAHEGPGKRPDVSLPGEREIDMELLDLGVGLPDGRHGLQPNGHPGDRIEELFETLRGQRIELRVSLADFRMVVGPDAEPGEAWVYEQSVRPEVSEAFAAFEIKHFAERGFRLPPLCFIVSERMPPGTVAVKLNAHLGPPMPGAVLRTDWETRTRSRRRFGADLLQAAIERFDRRSGERASPPPFITSVVLPVLDRAIDAAPQRLFGSSDAEYLLAQLDGGFPDLVHAVLARFSVPMLTRLLRGLVAEGVCIRDLRAILEALLAYEWVPFEAGEALVLDDRVVLPEVAGDDVAASWWFRLEAAHDAPADKLSQRLRRGELPVVTVGSALRAWAEQLAVSAGGLPSPPALSEDTCEQLRDALWAVPGLGPEPIVITSPGARRIIWELLSPEFPGISVVTTAHLPADRRVRTVARIDMP